MAIFLKYGSIKGETTQLTHKDWIEVNSFQFGVGRGISSGVGGGSKREASAPSVSEITLTKTMDIASPLLLKDAIGGKAVHTRGFKPRIARVVPVFFLNGTHGIPAVIVGNDKDKIGFAVGGVDRERHDAKKSGEEACEFRIDH